MKLINPNPFTTRPEIVGTFGVVTSSHWVASQVGMSVLERGGNAFDAAVCAALVLHVVEPHMNGIGGDVVILVEPSGDNWLLHIHWGDQQAQFSYSGFFAERFARLAQASIRSLVVAPACAAAKRRSAGA